MAILKFEAWHPGTKHGSTKQEEAPITKTWIPCFILLPRPLFMVLFRPALPHFVTGWQIIPLKIAASGARALLAMTNLVGFAGNRSNFRNETIENGAISGTKRLKNGAERHRAKNDRIKQKTSVFQTKTPRFGVIARPHCGRGNLKAEGMAFRGEAREHEARRNPYHKKHGFTASFCFLALYLWFCFVPRNHSSFRDGKSFR